MFKYLWGLVSNNTRLYAIAPLKNHKSSLVEQALPPLLGHFLTQDEAAWITQPHWDRHRDTHEWSNLSTMTHDGFVRHGSEKWPSRNACKKTLAGVVLMCNKAHYRLWLKAQTTSLKFFSCYSSLNKSEYDLYSTVSWCCDTFGAHWLMQISLSMMESIKK